MECHINLAYAKGTQMKLIIKRTKYNYDRIWGKVKVFFHQIAFCCKALSIKGLCGPVAGSRNLLTIRELNHPPAKLKTGEGFKVIYLEPSPCAK